jgi:hypothetical protein
MVEVFVDGLAGLCGDPARVHARVEGAETIDGPYIP